MEEWNLSFIGYYGFPLLYFGQKSALH